jgi:hypothetical protein
LLDGGKKYEKIQIFNMSSRNGIDFLPRVSQYPKQNGSTGNIAQLESKCIHFLFN